MFDENFLMSVATIGAFFVADYPEAVAVMLFYQVGELFQSIAVGKSRKRRQKTQQQRKHPFHHRFRPSVVLYRTVLFSAFIIP